MSHGRFAEGIMDAAKMIMGDIDDVATLSIMEGEAPETFESRMADCVATLHAGDEGVLVLSDLPGASPANTSLKVLGNRAVLVTGLNLGMLLEVLQAREGNDAEKLAAIAESSGRASIMTLRLQK